MFARLVNTMISSSTWPAANYAQGVSQDTEDRNAVSLLANHTSDEARPVQQPTNDIHIGNTEPAEHIDPLAAADAIGPVQGVPEIVAFVGTALGSGIIGNVAYDVLKGMIKNRDHRSPSAVRSVETEREQIARAAVEKRCAEVGFPIPDRNEPCDAEWDADESGYTYHLTFRHVVATVVVPRGNLEGRELQVTLRTDSEGFAWEWARREVGEQPSGPPMLDGPLDAG
jgi:hypothetical protein